MRADSNSDDATSNSHAAETNIDATASGANHTGTGLRTEQLMSVSFGGALSAELQSGARDSSGYTSIPVVHNRNEPSATEGAHNQDSQGDSKEVLGEGNDRRNMSCAASPEQGLDESELASATFGGELSQELQAASAVLGHAVESVRYTSIPIGSVRYTSIPMAPQQSSAAESGEPTIGHVHRQTLLSSPKQAGQQNSTRSAGTEIDSGAEEEEHPSASSDPEQASPKPNSAGKKLQRLASRVANNFTQAASQAKQALEIRTDELPANTRIEHNDTTGEVVRIVSSADLTAQDTLSSLGASTLNPATPNSMSSQPLRHLSPIRKPSFFCSRSVLEEVYGESVGRYARFQQYVAGVNVVLVLISLVAFIPHAVETGPKLRRSGQGISNAKSVDQALDFFMLSSFQPSHDKYWTAMMALTYAVAFLSGPLYFGLFKFEKFGFSSTRAEKVIVDNDVRTSDEDYEKCCGRVPKWRLQALSYSLFLLCVGIPMLLMYIFLFNLISVLAEVNYESWSGFDAQASQALLALAAGSSVSIANATFFLVVGVLTEIEMHRTHTQFRRHRLFKLCAYRIINTYALFVWSYYAELPWNLCVTKRIAMQHLLFVLADLVINNLNNLLTPFVFRLLCPFCPPCCYGEKEPWNGDKPIYPEFELTNEYLDSIFRQFLLFSATPVFPLISAVTLLANCIHWPFVKYRLLYLSRDPHGNLGGYPMQSFLLAMVAFCALFAFPTGWFWFARGPWLCWPCPQFSQIGGRGADVCSPEFEHVTCSLADGAPATVQHIRDQIDQLRHPDPAVVAAAEGFFGANEHLFWSKRCGCSPCVLAIDCPCSQPLLARQCEELAPFSCNLNASYAGHACLGVAAAAEECGGSPCVRNASWLSSQCGVARAAYSKPDADAFVPRCRAQALEGASESDLRGGGGGGGECQSDAECGRGGSCAAYCPVADDGRWVGERCWLCDAVQKGGLVDPQHAKAQWEALPFCHKCLASDCVCRHSCQIF